MDFNSRLAEALDDFTRYEVDMVSEEYQKTYKSIVFNESTNMIIGKVITELTARDLVTRMAMLAKREQRALTKRDLERVIAASLRAERFGMDTPDPVKAVADEVTQLSTDPGVIQSVHTELKKMGVELNA